MDTGTRRHPHLTWAPVAIAGLVAGTIDIGYAVVFWILRADLPPIRIFQSVAAGLLGPEAARSGGAATAALGLTLHFSIALTVASVYAVVARLWPVLVVRPWLWGMAYGAIVYVVMNRVVLPLSNAGPPASDPLWVALTILVHIFGIGVPCAFGARRALQNSR